MRRLTGGAISGGRQYVVGEQGTDAFIPSSRIVPLTPGLFGVASSTVVIKMENIREQHSIVVLQQAVHHLEKARN